MTSIFTLATTPSNQQNLLNGPGPVSPWSLYISHYGPPSTETPTIETTIVRCHKNSWIYLTSTYLLLVTFETKDNYSIWLEISNNSSTIPFNWIQNEKNTIRTALLGTDMMSVLCRSFSLTIDNLDGSNYVCRVAGLWGNVVPDQCYHKVCAWLLWCTASIYNEIYFELPLQLVA